MIINWFAALPPAETAGARLTLQIVPLLARHAETIVWSHVPEWDRAIESQVRVRSYELSKPPWREFNRASATFFILENELEWSGPLWAISRRYPGVVILQDLALQEFFTRLAIQDLFLTVLEYLALAEFYHPGAGRALGEMYFRGEITMEELAARCPLAGAMTGNALAVVVHSAEAFALLSRESACPVMLNSPPSEAYAAALLRVVENIEGYEVIWLARLISRRAGEAISQWCGESDASDALTHITEEIANLNAADFGR